MALRRRGNRDHQRLAAAARRGLPGRTGLARRSGRSRARPGDGGLRDRLHLLHRRPTVAGLALSGAAGSVPPRPGALRAGWPHRKAAHRRARRTDHEPPAARRSQEPGALAAVAIALPGPGGGEARDTALVGAELAGSPQAHARPGAVRRRGPLPVREGVDIRRNGRASLYSPARDRRPHPLHASAAPRSRAPDAGKGVLMAYVLGLNAYHAAAAACLVKDGTLVAAVEEERFRRIKHWGGFPSESIRYCLAEAGIGLGDVAHVAVNSDNRANRWRKLAYVLTSGVGPGYVLDRLRQRGDRADVAGNLKRHLPDQEFRGTVHAVEHHLCHLASAFLVSPYDKAVAVSVDGFGDFSSAAWGLGEGGALTVDGRVYFPHSLGVFYEAMTQCIGFPHCGDEYKVMGLAPYGEPRYVEAMKQIVKRKDDGSFALDLRYFRHAAGEGANYQVKDGIPSGGRLWSDALAEVLGPPRDPAAPLEDKHRDIARSAQATYENASSISCRRCIGAMAPTPSCWRAAAPTTRWPTARCLNARRSRSSTSSRRAAMPAARSVRPSRPGTDWAAPAPSVTS